MNMFLVCLNALYLSGSALNRLNSVAGQYAQACVQAAGQSGVDVLDLWTLMQKDGQVTHAGKTVNIVN